MKYLDAYRDPRVARGLLDQIREAATRPWTVLEVCGGQAHNLVRFGTDRALPDGLELIHGPACPISITPSRAIDRVLSIAARPGVIVGAPGDLLRVPGTRGRETLLASRDSGADVREIYSPLDALALARKHPDREVIVLALGFETTAAAAAAAVLEAERLSLDNLAFLTSYYRLAPATEALLSAPDNRARAVLASGPVCAVTGFRDYEPIAARFRVPVVITGPEPVDLLDALARAIHLLERGSYAVENQYARAVKPDGNPHARAAVATVFEVADADWRGLGRLAASGLVLRDRFRRFDAAARFLEPLAPPLALTECRDADVLTGRLKPFHCSAFGTRCTPERPLGASMVSAEGTCAAYYRYRRSHVDARVAPALDIVSEAVIPNG